MARQTPTPDPAGPRRTCVGCRTIRPQAELVRIVRAGDGTLHAGRTLPGRGAWLCQASPNCFDQAARRGGFSRAFRTGVDPEAIAQLRAVLGAHDHHSVSLRP
jgi:predicted RNA-binding protein YlxR (DUF448 family)